MLIREALKLIGQAKLSSTRRVALLCSFEPLHLKDYLQALLIERVPEGSPAVVTFGYDRLFEGLSQTASVLKASPALLCLDWADIHPGLSWRSRGDLSPVARGEIFDHSSALGGKLALWLKERKGAETIVAAPPVSWLPPLDGQSPDVLGPTASAAAESLHQLARLLGENGARVLDLPLGDLNYRDLLQAGFPLGGEASLILARHFVDLAYRPMERKKVLVVDLDETLWSGVIGEGGPEAIFHRAEGRGYPHHVFQKFLKKLKGEGILLAFCSKNNPGDVLPVFDSLEMPLKLSDFAAHRCNWEAKSANILSIISELNIGRDAVVLVDDNPAELAQAQAQLPDISVLRTPENAADWPAFFRALQGLFYTSSAGYEDSIRTASLLARPSAPAGPFEHLKDFQLQMTVNPEAFPDPRALELINKTNQFNLTGERLSKEDWLGLSEDPKAFCFSARLRDRYGDFGTICVAAGTARGDVLFLRQLVLSCRALGRGVEFLLLDVLMRNPSASSLRGDFKATGRNEPAAKFLNSLGCRLDGGGAWAVSRETVAEAARSILDQTGILVQEKVK